MTGKVNSEEVEFYKDTLVPLDFIKYLDEVFNFGQKKGYLEHGWMQHHGYSDRANDMSINRHVLKTTVIDEHVDPDSGINHRQFAATRLLMREFLERRGK